MNLSLSYALFFNRGKVRGVEEGATNHTGDSIMTIQVRMHAASEDDSVVESRKCMLRAGGFWEMTHKVFETSIGYLRGGGATTGAEQL